MKGVPFIIILAFVLGACQAAPSGTTITHPTETSFPSKTPLPTPTPTITITPTPTIIPTATTSPAALEERVGTLCERAYSSPVQTKQIDMPYLGMMKTERDRNPAWKVSNSIPHLFALSAESVHSIVCRLETRRQVGIYTDGSAAFTLTLQIRVLTYPEGVVVAAKTYQSGMPPKTKVGFGGGYGSYPEGSNMNEWILDQFWQIDRTDFLSFQQESIYSLATAPNGKSAALGISASPSGTAPAASRIMLVDLQNMQSGTEWEVHAGTLYDLAYSPDGDMIASAGNDSRVYFWDAQTGAALGMIPLPSNASRIQYSPDGKFIGVMTPSTIYLVDASSMQINAEYPPLGTTFSFSPDGKIIYTDGGGFDAATGDSIFQFYDPMGLEPTITADGAVSFDTPDAMLGFTVSQDGTHAVSYSPEPFEDISITQRAYYLSFWDLKTQERISRTQFVGNFFDILGFSPDGKQLAVNNNGGEIWLLDTSTQQVIRILAGHTSPVLELAFSPDGKKIISISRDRTMRVWSLED